MKYRLLGFVALVALVGCNKPSVPPAPIATVRGPAVADAAVVDAVKRRFESDRVLELDPLGVSVSNGVCTLWGTVGDPLAKERALHDVATMRGVREIIDQIAVTPVARPDADITADVKRELAADETTQAWPIRVAARGGRVTLSGTVPSWPATALVTDAVERIKGVRTVDNQLTPSEAAPRTDAEISTDVSAHLADDAWLDGTALEVDVVGGDVELRGVVASIADRERAVVDALVDGARRVDADAVVVDAERHDAIAHTLPRSLRTDADIDMAVRDAFGVDPRLDPMMPEVSTTNGVVQLTGFVPNAAARGSAERDAWDTLGVVRVEDHTVVSLRRTVSDSAIDHAIVQSFGDDMLVPDDSTVRASAKKGKVVLNGIVDSPQARTAAVTDALAAPGVAEVDDQLQLTRSAGVVQAELDDRFTWDASVGRGRVRAVVDDAGVATLSGTLDRWGEIRAAVRDAKLAGAHSVVNHLALKASS